jgi:hypothetical protein
VRLEIETTEAGALQLRKLLIIDSAKSALDAAHMADAIILNLTACVAPA